MLVKYESGRGAARVLVRALIVEAEAMIEVEVYIRTMKMKTWIGIWEKRHKKIQGFLFLPLIKVGGKTKWLFSQVFFGRH